jgi:hypothetical protein
MAQSRHIGQKTSSEKQKQNTVVGKKHTLSNTERERNVQNSAENKQSRNDDEDKKR